MCAILLAVLLLCVVGSSQAVDVASCSNGTESLTFTPYNDGVTGRYLVELCTALVPRATSWEVSLTYYESKECKAPAPLKTLIPGKIHSYYKQPIQVEGNCSHICLNTTLDLIFSKTYAIQTQFLVDANSVRRQNWTCVKVDNNYTIADFKKNKAIVDILYLDEEHLTIVFHTGVPFLSFDGNICKILDQTTGVEAAECPALTERSCTAPSPLEIRCPLALAAGAACYNLQLILYATWGSGVLRKQGMITHKFCKESLPDPAVEGSNPAWVWAAAALAAAGAASVAARVAWAALRRRTLHKAVLREWLVHRKETMAVPGPAAPLRRPVLLLYAREGPRAARVSRALRALLERRAGAQVYDIFSPEVVALAAAAPGAWIRGMLQRADVAVLLLQTPALAALYRAQDSATGRPLEPLLGRRVRYRAPACGDALLQYAVRLAADAPGDYRKYYVATLAELPTDIFPQLVPYRRYELPGAAPLLLHDVCGAAPPAAPPAAPAAGAAPPAAPDAAEGAALAALAAAAADFAEHARECPDYLMDELVEM